jgi:hypothetical protein
MSARRLAYLFGFVVLAISGLYVFVYLWRWEWNRAMFAGVLFIATEVALATATVLDRLRRLDERVGDVTRQATASRPPADPRVLTHLREAAPPPRAHFAWLRRTGEGGELGIFVPVLMGAGVVMSGLAWVVERVARATAEPVLERGLARRLAPLAFPADGLLGRPARVPASDATSRARGPVPR